MPPTTSACPGRSSSSQGLGRVDVDEQPVGQRERRRVDAAERELAGRGARLEHAAAAPADTRRQRDPSARRHRALPRPSARSARGHRAGRPPGGRRRRRAAAPRSPAITPWTGARAASCRRRGRERQPVRRLPDDEHLVAGLRQQPVAPHGERLAAEPRQRLRRAEPRRGTADEENAGERAVTARDDPRARLGVDGRRAVADEAAERHAAVGRELDGERRGRADRDEDGQPATDAFCTSSNESRPLTQRIESASGTRPSPKRPAEHLVHRVVAADVLAHAEQLSVRREEPGRVQPAGQGEGRLRLAQATGQRRDDVERTLSVALDPRRLDGDRLERALPADAARGRGVERPLDALEVGVGRVDLDDVRGEVVRQPRGGRARAPR